MACMQLALVRRHPPGPPRAVDQSWIEKEIQANVGALTCRQSRESATVGSDLRWGCGQQPGLLAAQRPHREPLRWPHLEQMRNCVCFKQQIFPRVSLAEQQH